MVKKYGKKFYKKKRSSYKSSGDPFKGKTEKLKFVGRTYIYLQSNGTTSTVYSFGGGTATTPVLTLKLGSQLFSSAIVAQTAMKYQFMQITGVKLVVRPVMNLNSGESGTINELPPIALMLGPTEHSAYSAYNAYATPDAIKADINERTHVSKYYPFKGVFRSGAQDFGSGYWQNTKTMYANVTNMEGAMPAMYLGWANAITVWGSNDLVTAFTVDIVYYLKFCSYFCWGNALTMFDTRDRQEQEDTRSVSNKMMDLELQRQDGDLFRRYQPCYQSRECRINNK